MTVTTHDHPDTRRRSGYPAAAVLGIAAILLGSALLGLLHVLPQTNGISPIEETISEYAFTTLRWLFSLAVLLVAAGTTAVFGVLIHSRGIRALPVTSVAAGLWGTGLVVLVLFEKTNWAVGPSTSGAIHRIASVIAFLAIPLAIIGGARTLFRDARRWRRLSHTLAAVSWLSFAIIPAAIGWTVAGGPIWWRMLPLGLIERVMAVSAVLAVVVLAVGIVRQPPAPRESRKPGPPHEVQAAESDGLGGEMPRHSTHSG